jgi:hypothetical protein
MRRGSFLSWKEMLGRIVPFRDGRLKAGEASHERAGGICLVALHEGTLSAEMNGRNRPH